MIAGINPNYRWEIQVGDAGIDGFVKAQSCAIVKTWAELVGWLVGWLVGLFIHLTRLSACRRVSTPGPPRSLARSYLTA